tara:strand:- start:965 stop:2050 length:1086 start_codon:yes stop_codon:yes gene_type:complete
MIIGSVSENKEIEKRISITPEIAKKYISNGFEILIESEFGSHLGISDEKFKQEGCKIHNKEDVLKNADIILQLNLPNESYFQYFKENNIIIGNFNSNQNLDKINKIKSNNTSVFSLELLPRITRAQSMDILSSQANLAGYKAVIDSFAIFKKAIPMMMTAAGTISAAKVLVVGAGVAGLQAIATAKRMGAIVFATDVRIASKEQVESLGGKFLVVDGAENLETEGGYAKEASEDFKKKQEDLITETLKKIDIVICTALIPGKKAPKIITEKMLENMEPGSIVYDLAASQGGNSAYTKVDEVVEKNGITIIGESTILNKLPSSASNLYAKNLFNFVLNLYDKKENKININMEDEIINKTLVK